jgi:nicotinamide mononucleotide (NMN) deamidase PncC
MPLYLPTTSAAHAASLTVWGELRAAPDVLSAYGLGSAEAQIQFAPGSSSAFTTVKTVSVTNIRGYFDTKQTFTRSGTVRIAWSLPGGATTYSRTQAITIR